MTESPAYHIIVEPFSKINGTLLTEFHNFNVEVGWCKMPDHFTVFFMQVWKYHITQNEACHTSSRHFFNSELFDRVPAFNDYLNRLDATLYALNRFTNPGDNQHITLPTMIKALNATGFVKYKISKLSV